MTDYPTHYPDGTRYLFSAMFGTVAERERDADRAVIARIGGNEYRRRLADRVTRHQPIVLPELDRWIAQDAASLAAGESYLRYHYSDPWDWTDTEGNKHHDAASVSGPDHAYSRRTYPARVPESAFDWPIYRAGVVARIMAGGALAALALLFPDPLTRPLYTIDDMDMHARRLVAETRDNG